MLLVWPCNAATAADLIFVHAPADSPSMRHRVELAAEFYGLRMNVLSISAHGFQAHLQQVLRDQKTVAAVVSGNAVFALNRHEVLAALKRRQGRNIPLLLLDVNEAMEQELLRDWSAGTIEACKVLPTPLRQSSYAIVGPGSVVRQLAGQELPLNTRKACGLVLDTQADSQVILQLHVGHSEYPAFARAIFNRQEIFFLANVESVGDLDASRVVPLLMFIRYAAGEQAWHSFHRFANLTIDDPWLTEPYGHLSFVGLLNEMRKANFHTTIAFIPWNFDRSQPDVMSLIRNSPERFSIAIHGNNHDGQEFEDERPLRTHETNIQQALARMAKFSSLTGLPYDSVMVFPRKPASPDVLALLKKHHLRATVNAGNFVSPASNPESSLPHLRSVTLRFANFPSARRYPAETARLRFLVAMNAFLDNPLLFYAHHDFFAKGIDSFNPVAQAVNEIEPTAVWQSLGHIVEHFYVVRLTHPGEYEVRAFSSVICLDNPTDRSIMFTVKKEENNVPRVRAVIVGGVPVPYRIADGQLALQVPVPRKGSRYVTVEYEGASNGSAIDVSKSSIRVGFLRWMADFRDLTLSRTKPGRVFIRLYYAISERELIATILILVLVAFSGWLLARRRTRNIARISFPPSTRLKKTAN